VVNLPLLTGMTSAHILCGVLSHGQPPEVKLNMEVCGDESFVAN
jgi:hypothetical protein